MKPLPEHTHRKGCFYDLEKRNGHHAIYSLRYTDGGPNVGFEVFRVHRMRGYEFKGKIIPPYERFPYDREYGFSAWSFDKKKTALIKFKSYLT